MPAVDLLQKCLECHDQWAIKYGEMAVNGNFLPHMHKHGQCIA